MKVMYFIHSLCVGGAETICTKNLLALKERNVDVVLVVISRTNSFLEAQLRKNGIKIISICPLMRSNFIYSKINGLYWRLISLKDWWNKTIYAEKPDVIHIHTMAFDFFDLENFSCSKLIYTFHGKVERYLNLMSNKARMNLQRYSAGGMKFFALSNEMEEDIRVRLSTENVVYMPNAVEIDKIRSTGYKREEFLPTLNIPTDSFVLGHVARFHKVKNQERTVNIFKEVLKIRPDSYLVFVGDCNNKCGKKIRKLVGKYGLCERVIFLGVKSDAANIMAVFNSMILPSYTESFSLVMVEAQAHNVRAVASMTVPESVICNDNCFRLPLEDSNEKWAQYLVGDFIESHNYKLDEFSMGNVVDKLVLEYKKSANNRNAVK